jgi:hypothetical protein
VCYSADSEGPTPSRSEDTVDAGLPKKRKINYFMCVTYTHLDSLRKAMEYYVKDGQPDQISQTNGQPDEISHKPMSQTWSPIVEPSLPLMKDMLTS